MRIRQPLFLGLLSPAFFCRVIAAVGKSAAHRKVGRVGHQSANRLQSRRPVLDVGQRIEQSLRVGMPCAVEYVRQASMLDHRAGVHDGNFIAHFGNDSQVVGNHQNGCPKLITKVHRVNYGDIIGSLGIGSIIYPKNITAERIVQFVRGMSASKDSNIETLYKLNDDRVEALEFIVRSGSPVIGSPLSELKLKKGILIACINHYGEIITPSGDTVIRDRDSVIVLTMLTGLQDINDILEK